MEKINTIGELINAKTVAVHSGPFHADDVISVALLQSLGFRGDVVRTRDPEVLKDVIGIDVAGSRTGGQFDHHGQDAVEGVCALTKLWSFTKPQLDDQVEAGRFDKLMWQAFSAVADIDSGAVSNPADRPNMFGWVSLTNDGTDEGFFVAVRMVQTILISAWDHAREWSATLEEARAALTWDGTPPVLDVERRGTKEALHQLGCEAPFFVSPHGAEWAVLQTCPKGRPFNPFGSSRVLPKGWGGLRGEELQKVSGYKSAIFAFAPGGGETVMAFFGDKADAIACAEEACK